MARLRKRRTSSWKLSASSSAPLRPGNAAGGGVLQRHRELFRHLGRREAGSTPWTLLDYFPDDFLVIIDESHMTIPQLHGMYNGDRARKETLIDFGFRLPSALDNRPLKFAEFEDHVHDVIYASATPGPYELKHSSQVVEQIIRPTGLLDPEVDIRPTKGQIDDLLKEIRLRLERGERTLVTTLTKRMSEELADYLLESGIKVHYLHSEIHTLERVEILRDLRMGVYDVVVGINLLREGLDLPEVSLVAILDADKEGFSGPDQRLIQTTGRAARHVNGRVIMYADKMTPSMQAAIDETNRRRQKQKEPQPSTWHLASQHRQTDSRSDRTGARRGRNKSRVSRWHRHSQRRIAPAHQRAGEADEGGRHGAGVRESRAASR